jgi:hypothetical protein
LKAISALALALAVAASAAPALAQDNVAGPALVAIKAGETLSVRTFTVVTLNCSPLYTGFEGLDVSEGASDLLT